MEKEILHLQQLSPKGNINTDGYTEAIDYALKNMEIRNVALSGTYGSGKSSIMRSYENMHKEKKCIHISLAHFEEQEGRNIAPQGDPDEEGKSKGNKTNHQNLINMLEGKIFNQLLHQVSPSAIPKARFQRKEDTSFRSRIFNAVCIVLFILICVFLPNYREWNALVAGLNESPFKRILNITTSPIMPVAGCILLIGLIALGVYYIIQTQSLSRVFKKIDFKGIFGVELFTSENDSIFDRYLNDVIYLFDNSGAEIIVFEDLDRYEVTKIFEELREINDLIARRRQQRGDPKVLRFFYLIRDDVFTSSDRSKFFDLIIPVVPVIDTSNTYDMFIEQFEKARIEDQFNKKLLQDVSLYLSDMRLVTNIINEYLIYKSKLSKNRLTERADNRLAMLIYKNLYPHDFDLLLQGKGYVAALFNQKDKLSKNLCVQYKEQIQALEEKLKEADDERLTELDELNAIFFPLNHNVYSVAGEAISSKITRIDLVKRVLNNPDAVIYRDPPYGSQQLLNVAELEKHMNENPEYQHRKANIELKRGQMRNNIEDELAQLKIKSQQMRLYSLKELIKQTGVGTEKEKTLWTPPMPPYEDINYVDEIKKSHGFKLLQYLIREGYIDENYATDVSNFYPNSLTPEDKNFLLSLAERNSLGPEYKLQRPQAILERLDSSHFALRECWNFDLLEYLFSQGDTKTLKIWFAILDGLDSNQSAYKFLLDFLKGTKYRKDFVSYVSSEFPTWFRNWTMGEILNGETWRDYCFTVIQTVSPLTLERINGDDWLTKQISNDSGFLAAYSGDIDLLIKGLEVLDVQFQQIDIGRGGSFFKLLYVVHEHNLYALNYEMLEFFMSLYWKANRSDIQQKSYTLLSMKRERPLYKRISQNMNEYMAVILENENAHFLDEGAGVLELLNHTEIMPQYKQTYIQRLGTKIDILRNVENTDFWAQILKSNAVEYNAENILDYYAEKCSGNDPFPEELISFLTQNREVLNWSRDGIDNYLKQRDKSGYDFRLALVKSTDLPIDRYRALLKSINYLYTAFPVDNLPEDRVQILIDLRMLSVTEKNTELIRQNYAALLIDFVLVGQNRFIGLIEKGNVSPITEEELSMLLKDSRMDHKILIRIIDTYSGYISQVGKGFPDDIVAYIINTKFDPDEIPWFLKNYDTCSNIVKEAFKRFAIEDITTVFDMAIENETMPLELYAALLDKIDPDSAKALIEYLPNKEYADACKKRHRPAFDNTEINRTILKFFQKAGWISSYGVTKNGKLRSYPKEK